jgi:hypothetical protein
LDWNFSDASPHVAVHPVSMTVVDVDVQDWDEQYEHNYGEWKDGVNVT